MLDNNKLFKDPEFGPESKYNPIYFNGDLDARLSADLEIPMRTLTWLRPNEIAPKPKLIGFSELNINNHTPNEL